MSLYKGCPRAIRFGEVVPEYVDYPECGEEMETWLDEPVARSPHCQAQARRDRGPSCIDWCHYVEECIGVEAHERLRYPPPSEGKKPNEKSQRRT